MEDKKHLCPLCGTEMIDGVCPKCNTHFKPMCLNCVFLEAGCCQSPENKIAAIEKIKANMPAGYELSSIELKPLELKDPTKKCKNYSLNVKKVKETILSILAPNYLTTVTEIQKS